MVVTVGLPNRGVHNPNLRTPPPATGVAARLIANLGKNHLTGSPQSTIVTPGCPGKQIPSHTPGPALVIEILPELRGSARLTGGSGTPSKSQGSSSPYANSTA